MKTRLILCCLLLSLFFAGCEDIFLKDLSAERVVVLSPADGALLEGEKILFIWNRLEGAQSYHLVVSSSSSGRALTVHDAVTDTTRVELPLGEGKYEWSIYGYNSGYQSKKISRTFEIQKNEE